MKRRTGVRVLALAAALVIVVSACGGDDDDAGGSGGGTTISIDGSSTVAPLSEAAAEDFMADNDVDITVGTSGTGGGFEKFCQGETDINDASRPIKADDDAEGVACKNNNIEYTQLQVANDGLSVVVNKENDWAKCLTVEQLKTMWEPDAEGKVDNWNQIDSSFPDEPLDLYGPGTDSGTFDYFTDAINGEEGASRTDYTPSEDDNVTVTGVEGSKGGLGYFGLSYYEENADELNLVEVDNGDGCVAPSRETVQSGDYAPLSRPLFIYPNKELLGTDIGAAFVEYYLDNAVDIAGEVKFVPLTDAQLETAKQASADLKAGSSTSSTT